MGKYEVSDLVLDRDYHDLIRMLEIFNLTVEPHEHE